VLGTMLALFLVDHYSTASLQRPSGGAQPELQLFWQREHMTLEELFRPYRTTIEDTSKNTSKHREER